MRGNHCVLRGACKGRPGFALLAVLWIIIAAAALGVTISLAARESVAAARNRASGTRAMWRAHDCLERARVAIGEALAGSEGGSPRMISPWLILDSTVVWSRVAENLPCEIEFRASGLSVDINAADAEMLGRLFHAVGIMPPRADSMIDALLDWRDDDTVARPFGAERVWYVQAHRATPRNGPLAADREIALVRGFDAVPALDGLLTAEPSRLVLPLAPLALLAALPGVEEEALARIAERRLREPWPLDLVALGSTLSPDARAALLAYFAELSRLTAAEPEAWIVRTRGRDRTSSVTAVIEARLVRAGARAAIVRRQSWIE